jgi:hypothetical protein
MQEGDKVDILDILEDNSSVIIRAADERVGYYNLDFLATADEVRHHIYSCFFFSE